jgi:GMP reductase
MEVALDYEDVLIVPKINSMSSRNQVDMSMPRIFASNMDGVGTIPMARVLEQFNVSTVLHKYHDFSDIAGSGLNKKRTWFSIGMVSDDELERVKHLYESTGYGICIDVANGYMTDFHEFVHKVRQKCPSAKIMAGNVCTPEGAVELEKAGADFIKVGIGPGAVCTTRIKTGVGMPQLTAVMECVAAVKSSTIIADGGIQHPGDVAKALVAGAGGVMIGSMFAGHREGFDDSQPLIDYGKSVKFYGMSSKAAQSIHGNVKDYRASEGRVVLIPYKGSVVQTVTDLLGGLRSACTYTGSEAPSELHFRASLRLVRRQINNSMAQHAE